MKKVLLTILIIILILSIGPKIVAAFPEASADSVKQVVGNFKARIVNNDLSQEELQSFALSLQAAFADQKLDSTDVVKLLETMK